MNGHNPIDLIKEIVWNLFVYVLYYIWCFVMLLIIHFLLYRFIKGMDWTLSDIALYAFFASTVIMIGRVVGLVKKRK